MKTRKKKKYQSEANTAPTVLTSIESFVNYHQYRIYFLIFLGVVLMSFFLIPGLGTLLGTGFFAWAALNLAVAIGSSVITAHFILGTGAALSAIVVPIVGGQLLKELAAPLRYGATYCMFGTTNPHREGEIKRDVGFGWVLLRALLCVPWAILEGAFWLGQLFTGSETTWLWGEHFQCNVSAIKTEVPAPAGNRLNNPYQSSELKPKGKPKSSEQEISSAKESDCSTGVSASESKVVTGVGTSVDNHPSESFSPENKKSTKSFLSIFPSCFRP